MYFKDSNDFMKLMQQYLCEPNLRAKCIQLSGLLERANLMELHTIFPVIVDHIFGPKGTLSWGLRSTTDELMGDFREVHNFLSPCGPFFNVIYKLLRDTNFKYEFPLNYLPSKIRQFLEASNSNGTFYADLLLVNPQTKKAELLLLNAFDYYIFHFAYHLINPFHQRSGSIVRSWNTIYYCLACEYVLHFLPTDPAKPVQPVICFGAKNPINSVQPSVTCQPISPLLHKQAVNKSLDESSFHKNLNKQPRNEIWRSETVLTVFVDMWLHNDQISQTTPLNAFNVTSVVRQLPYNELPTGEYMRIVRVLLKQIHAFSASARVDDTYLCELKRIAIPMIQGKFYIFLRNLIHRWPLDGSFRMALELWLTYVQPWRYAAASYVPELNKKEVNPDLEDVGMGPSKAVERDYLPFISENLLAYVVIFQQLLPRFCRVDLVSPKMALMLYRMSKVFGQPNLVTYLKEIELCVENNSSPTHKYNSQWASQLPPLSPTSAWSTNTSQSPQKNSSFQEQSSSKSFNNLSQSYLNPGVPDKKWLAIVRQKIFELEGPNFCYKPLFSNPPAPEVFDLIVQIKRSIGFAEELVAAKRQEEEVINSNLWTMIKSFFFPKVSTDEFTLTERSKVPLYLDVSLRHLKEIFQIEEGEDQLKEQLNTSPLDLSKDFQFLTPERVKTRIGKIKYEGDPDLLPIKNTENTFLVRVLYQLATTLNTNYGPQFYRSYHDPTYLGRLSRQILCPPMTVYKYDKSIPGSPRVASNLPPRISLRFMAGYKFLFYFFMGLSLAWLLGYSPISYLLVIILICFMYKCLKAIRSEGVAAEVRHNYPTQGFGNISFDDSF